ncbi:MAG: sigma-70 family RNA polymerase sigma factor [Treponema sp.]|nr:sigma-70 family RNA polymerase sigma factor [Treponema sp.]
MKEDKDTIIKNHLHLLASIANKYTMQGLNILDLLHEGARSLIRAAEDFDYQSGEDFSAYAAGLIEKEIARAVAEKDKCVRIPVHMIKQGRKLTRESRRLLQELGRQPRDEEIAEGLTWTLARVKGIKDFLKTTAVKKDGGATLEECIEEFDIDGPASLEADRIARELCCELFPDDDSFADDKQEERT